MLPEKIILLAVLINLIGYFFLIRDIFSGKTKPNLVSWFIWSLAPFIGVFFQIKAGASFSTITVFLGGLISLVVVIFSLFKKEAYWKLNSFDLICGFIAIFSLFLYVVTHDLNISILFAIFSDALAYLPTIKKSWFFPTSETGIVYITGVIAAIIVLFTIKNWIFPIYSFNMSIIFFNLLTIFVIYRKKFIS